jgi:hypothetical protein
MRRWSGNAVPNPKPRLHSQGLQMVNILSKSVYRCSLNHARTVLERPMIGKDGDRPNEVPDAAHYIASLAQELAELAKTHELEALAYILDMARLEADQICKRGQGAKSLAG